MLFSRTSRYSVVKYVREPRNLLLVVTDWPVLLQRRRGWISRQDLHERPSVFRRFLAKTVRGFPLIGPMRAGRRSLEKALTAWAFRRASHAQTVANVIQVCAKMEPRQDSRLAWEVLERISVNLGLYSVSLRFAQLAAQRAEHDARRVRTQVAFESALLSSIHWGERPRAEELHDLVKSEAETGESPGRLAVVDKYMKLWGGQNRPGGEPTESTDTFRELVRGRKVLLYGPGPVDSSGWQPQDFDLVVRTAGFGKYAFDHPTDLAGGRADIVYVNPEVVAEHSPQDRVWALDQLSGYRFVVTKRRGIGGLTNNRVATNLSGLFLRGHPHKATLAILDLLLQEPESLFVCGVSFFASTQAYRGDALGLNVYSANVLGLPGKFHDPSGSEGGDFDLAWQYASHNIRENFALIRNLRDVDCLSGDSHFVRVLGLEIEDYMREMDGIYGLGRL